MHKLLSSSKTEDSQVSALGSQPGDLTINSWQELLHRKRNENIYTEINTNSLT